jgi:hypothetical protein
MQECGKAPANSPPRSPVARSIVRARTAEALIRRLARADRFIALNGSPLANIVKLVWLGTITLRVRRNLHSKLISWGRALRDLVPSNDNEIPAETSPLLIYIAVALALLLAMLEIDLHGVELQALGLLSDPYGVGPIFKSP